MTVENDAILINCKGGAMHLADASGTVVDSDLLRVQKGETFSLYDGRHASGTYRFLGFRDGMIWLRARETRLPLRRTAHGVRLLQRCYGACCTTADPVWAREMASSLAATWVRRSPVARRAAIW